MNNKDLKITCTKAAQYLTVGKQYTSLGEVGEFYTVINDKLEVALYSRNIFSTVPNDKYEPIRYQIKVNANMVTIEDCYIDEELIVDSSGCITKYANSRSINNQLSVVSTGRTAYYKASDAVDIKNGTNVFIVENNDEAIELAYRISKQLQQINRRLKFMKKAESFVYMIEHKPNGKRHAYFSDDKINVGDLVVCNSSKGDSYGVCREVTKSLEMRKLATKKCKLVNAK